MNRDDVLDPTTERIMNEADPLRARSDDYPGLETEPALRYTQARQARAARAPARPRRRVWQLGAVAACVAAATIIVLNLTTTGPVKVPPANAAVLAQARRVLIGHPDAILEIDAHMTGKQTSTAISWTELGGDHNSRLITSQPGKEPYESAVRDGTPEIYDAATDTIYVGATLTAPGALNVGPVAWIGMLDANDVTIQRNAKLDGQPAIEVTQHQGSATNRYWMQPGTYRPLQFMNSVRGIHTFVVIRYRRWRLVSRAGHAALTSLTAQHPSARVVVDPSEYQKVSAQLEK
jgi:hypothetical protein